MGSNPILCHLRTGNCVRCTIANGLYAMGNRDGVMTFLKSSPCTIPRLGQASRWVEQMLGNHHLRRTEITDTNSKKDWILSKEEGVFPLRLKADRGSVPGVGHVHTIDFYSRQVWDCVEKNSIILGRSSFAICDGDEAGTATFFELMLISLQREGEEEEKKASLDECGETECSLRQGTFTGKGVSRKK